MRVVIVSILAMLGSFQLTRVVWNVVMVNSRKVTIEVNASQAPDLTEFGSRVKNVLENWYSPIKNLLNSDEFREVQRVHLHFDPSYNGVAYSIWELKTIIGSAEYYRKNPNDIGSMVHELVHIIQQFPWDSKENCPRWITEGIADWVRFYVFEPNKKPNKPWASEHYTSGYQTAAYFINYLNRKWVVTKDGKLDAKLISWLSMNCRAGTYKDIAIKHTLGKTIDTFWKEMMTEVVPFSVKVDTTHVPEMNDFGIKVKATLEYWYPYFAEKLNSSTFQPVDTIKISFTPTLRGAIGYHSLRQKRIVGAADYFRGNQDMEFWVKSMTHIVQQYQGKSCPEWVKIGIADWAWYWHVEPSRKPGKPRNGKSYKQGWLTSAYFINWMNERHLLEGENVTYWLNRKCREDTFNVLDFKRLTGKSVDELWNEMMLG